MGWGSGLFIVNLRPLESTGMIRYLIKEDGRLRELDEPQSNCWVNIEPPFTHEELEEVANQFDIPLDFLTDSLDIDERSRYEREEDVRLIVLSGHSGHLGPPSGPTAYTDHLTPPSPGHATTPGTPATSTTPWRGWPPRPPRPQPRR